MLYINNHFLYIEYMCTLSLSYLLDANHKLRGLGFLQSRASSSVDKVTDDRASD